MDQSIVESVDFAYCLNNSCDARAVLACTRVVRCFQAVFQRVALALLTVAFLSSVLSPGTVKAATVAAGSCSSADVSAAVKAAQNGDTVLIPPGTCTWNSGLGSNCGMTGQDSFCRSTTTGDTKYLTIQGAGIGQTVIIDAVPKNNNPSNLMTWLLNGNGLSRITGIEVRGTPGMSGPGVCQGIGTIPNIAISGASNQLRIDHNKFVTHGGCPALMIGGSLPSYTRGVVDHNFFDISGVANDPHGGCFFAFHQSWGGVGDQGDNSWAQPDTVGTAEAIFFEDNIFHNDQSQNWLQVCTEGWNGLRIVVRYNNFRATIYAHHGTGSGVRSTRQYEVYNNTWTGPDGVSAWDLKGNATLPPIGSRGGVGVVFNNTQLYTNGGFPTQSHNVVDERQPGAPNAAGIYGACNGTTVWDQNSSSTGRLCIDQTGAGYGDMIDSLGTSKSGCPGPFPTNVTRGCIQTWPRQVLQPTYGWNNTINGVVAGAKIDSSNGGATPPPITLGTDVVDGQRPSYTPYTYPHPLTTGGTTSGPLPQAPTGLHVQ